ncbi:DUF3801 domain-containing protein [Paenibacillus sp. SN-8-1]|uniref:DUF3801 domain-containing protein n=1 Tax=Paenibacillus sp. SN-8-1 TaxID=3435409 RepID=UPI003D9A929E
MSELGGDVASVVTRVGVDLSREAMKITNESMKLLLIHLIKQAREREDRPGEKSLQKLLKSQEEIKMFDLDKQHLKEFAEKAKKYAVSFSIINDQGNHSVFYKSSEENRVKSILESLVQKELSSNELDERKAVPFEIVDNHRIRVPNAILDMKVNFQRDLAVHEGVNVDKINPTNDSTIQQDKVQQYEVVSESEIKVHDAVLDTKVGFQRDLAQREGFNIDEILENAERRQDERYQAAVNLAREEGQISIPKLQEELGYNYAQASLIMDRMEAEKPVYVKEPIPEHSPAIEAGKQSLTAVNHRENDTTSEVARIEPNEKNGQYEMIDESRIRVPSVTLDLNNAQHRQLAESYGIKVEDINFKRETSDLEFEKAEIKGRETLSDRLGRDPEDRSQVARDMLERINSRLSLEERRQEIRPLMESQRQAPPEKNRNRELGGR